MSIIFVILSFLAFCALGVLIIKISTALAAKTHFIKIEQLSGPKYEPHPKLYDTKKIEPKDYDRLKEYLADQVEE